jgi:hypothetical protein
VADWRQTDAIDKREYQVILRNYDRIKVALLAIDAAGGFPHLPPVTISDRSVNVSGGTGAQTPAAAPETPADHGTPAAPAADKGSKGAGNNGGASSDVNITGTAGGVAKVDSPAGFINGDRVIKTVLDYMLDDNSWLTAACLAAFEDISKSNPGGMPGELPPPIMGNPADSRAVALATVITFCQQQPGKAGMFRAPRLYSADLPAAAAPVAGHTARPAKPKKAPPGSPPAPAAPPGPGH